MAEAVATKYLIGRPIASGSSVLVHVVAIDRPHYHGMMHRALCGSRVTVFDSTPDWLANYCRRCRVSYDKITGGDA